jgi:hypothetical protein
LAIKQGARTSVYLASSEDIKGVTGKHFSKGKEKKLKAIALNQEYKNLVWQKINTLLNTMV